MKKNKLSNAPSQNTSPVPYRKSYNDSVVVVDLPHLPHHPPAITLPAVPTVDSVTSALSRSLYVGGGSNDYETIDQRKIGSSSSHSQQHSKDPEYETIPGDLANNAADRALANATTSAGQAKRFSAGSNGPAAGISSISASLVT